MWKKIEKIALGEQVLLSNNAKYEAFLPHSEISSLGQSDAVIGNMLTFQNHCLKVCGTKWA